MKNLFQSTVILKYLAHTSQLSGHLRILIYYTDDACATFKYDEAEVENVAQGCSPSATFSTEVQHICDFNTVAFLIYKYFCNTQDFNANQANFQWCMVM